MTVYVLPKWAKTELPTYDVTTRGTSPFSRLSPMFLGPVHLYGGHVAQNVENGWQYSKFYPGMSGNDYWRWAANGWADPWANRYPMGKGAKPLYSLWDGEKLDYIAARKRIYVPLYSGAVRKHASDTLQLLDANHQYHGDIALKDFDAYDHRALGYSWDDVLNDPSRKMGHAFVLAMMLEGIM